MEAIFNENVENEFTGTFNSPYELRVGKYNAEVSSDPNKFDLVPSAINDSEGRNLTICIENEREKVMITCSDIKRLRDKSEYFYELLDNLTPSDEEMIHLPEEDVFEACGLLSDLLKRSRGEGVQKRWNQSWAKLSAKWMIPEYVDIYAEIAQSFLKRFLSQNKASGSLMLQGAKNSGSLRFINGIYDQTDKRNDGLPVFKKRGDSNWWLCFNRTESRWEVRSSDRCYAYVVSSDTNFTPDMCNEIWKVCDFASNEWQSVLSISVKKFALEKEPLSSEDITVFWEIAEVMLTHCAYQKGQKFEVDQLLDALVKHKELWSKEKMEKLLSKQDFMTLCEMMNSNT